MARDRLAALRAQNGDFTTGGGSPTVSSPQQSSFRRSYPDPSLQHHSPSTFSPPQQRRAHLHRPQQQQQQYEESPNNNLRQYALSRSPPSNQNQNRPPLSSPQRNLQSQWTPTTYFDEPESYSPYVPPARGTPQPPSRMLSPTRDLFEGSSPPRDFNPNDPDGSAHVRHRNVTSQRRSPSGRQAIQTLEDYGGVGVGGGGRGGGGGDVEEEKSDYRFGESSRGTLYTGGGDTITTSKRGGGGGGGSSEEGETMIQSMPTLGRQSRGSNGSGTVSRGQVPFEEMGEFFGEISSIQDDIKEANVTIDLIHNLYARYLACPSSEDVQALALHDQLAQKTSSTRGLFSSLRNRIHVLEQGNANLNVMIPLGQSIHHLTLSDVSVRQQQVQNLKGRFKESIQKYAEVEKDNRAKNRAKMERQVRIVYPQLSYEELQGIVRQAEQEGGSAMFAQALRSNGYRSRQAQGALREVQTRAAELNRIEETLVELAQIFEDMATLVEAQDVAITKIEDDAMNAQLDMEIGLENTKQAVHHARLARKRRWICFFIFVICIIVIIIVVVVKVILPNVKNNSNSEESDPNSDSAERPNANTVVKPSSTAKAAAGGGGGTVTVTATTTTTVVIVRQPATAAALMVDLPEPSSRQVLITVDLDALKALASFAHTSFDLEPTSISHASSSHRSPSHLPSATSTSGLRSSISHTSSGHSASPSPTRLVASPSSHSALHSSSHASSRSFNSGSSRFETRTRTSSTSVSSLKPSSSSNVDRKNSVSLSSSSPSPSASSAVRSSSSSSQRHSQSIHSASSSSHHLAPSSIPRSSIIIGGSSQGSSSTGTRGGGSSSLVASTTQTFSSIIKALLRRYNAAATPTITF